MTDWARLGDAYGSSAAEVPRLIEQLYAEDEETRKDSIDELWTRLCHQETVYPASAAAVPRLAEAARSAPLTPLQRLLILGLVVYIGRGEDTCWKGYTTREVVEECRAAVAAVVPELVRWSVSADAIAQAAALELGVYHPREFEVAGVPAASLLQGDHPAPVQAGAVLARAIIAGVPLGEDDIRAAAAANADVLDYLEQAMVGEPLDRQARAVALELLDRAAYGE